MDQRVWLRRKEELRLLAGHPWIFSNEIQKVEGSPESGDVVEVLTSRGRSLGVGFYHPHSLIAVRLLSRVVEEISVDFFRRKLEQARALRSLLYPGNEVYRLVHGESDVLPGLVIDRFQSTLVVQTFSSGMDRRLSLFCDALEEMFHPSCIVERNESPLRALESLPVRKGLLRGAAREMIIEEFGLRFAIHPLEGQKTGFFLDQRENRFLARRYCPGARVLDCFCNDGGFALNAVRGGAKEVLALDASEEEIRRARRNAELNQIDSITFTPGDVFETLERLQATGERFDVVILDPPSFTRNKKSVPSAKRGYRELHTRAFRVLHPGGMLLTSSCSHHIVEETFLEVIQEAARRGGRTLQMLDWRGAAPDHPTLPGVEETRYLKFGVFRVL